jgi:hypothetical protein
VIEPFEYAVVAVVAILVFLATIKYPIRLVRFVFRQLPALRQVVLDGAELDGETRERLAAAFDLLPDEEILGYFHRRPLLSREQIVVLTQQRIACDRSIGRVVLPLHNIGNRTYPDTPRGLYGFGLYGREGDEYYGGMTFEVIGRRSAKKFDDIISRAMDGRADVERDARIPRQTVKVKKRMEISFYVVIPAVPMIIGVILFAVTWSQISQTWDRLARGQTTMGNVIGYDDKYDYDEGTTDFYPVVRYSLAQGGLSTFTSSAGGMKTYDIGAEVEVLYDPAQPENAVIKSFKELYLAAILTGLLGAVFFGFGAMMALMIRSGFLK